MNFHHPYHFVPFGLPSGGLDRQEFEKGQPEHVTHDRYVPGTHSGRIVCGLETVTPVFVGSHRHEGTSPIEVENYTLNGQLAIPASSLRGMVSSLSEAASNSALRVLNSRARYSVRKPLDPKYVLSAIGMVLGDEAKGFHLQPICLPTMRASGDGYATLERPYWSLFPEPNLKVYIGNANSIRNAGFLYKTYDPANPKWYALPLEPRAWSSGYRLADDEFQHRKPVSSRGFALGQLPLKSGLEPVPVDQVKQHAREADVNAWVQGVIRVLGCWGNRKDSIPTGKKHELFLPFPTSKNWPVVKLSDEIVGDFHELCDARMRASWDAHRRKPKEHPLLPFEPKDTRPNREMEKTTQEQAQVRIKQGDIVYFGAEAEGKINEISFSAIWRKSVRNENRPARTREFFPAELCPFSEKRKSLSEAELLFGFVEDLKDVQKTIDRPSLALASRVRFSAALLSEQPGKPALLEQVKLRVLDSPKPPCPSLYFRPRGNPNGGFIGKMDLDAKRHEAQGRKYYLHQPPQGEPWESRSPDANADQQSKVHPISTKQVFFFHIDFDNLTDKDLGLLLYALSPLPGFRHKIGMGKGIGLGSVHIQPLAFFRVDRKQRYTPEGLGKPRYHGAMLMSDGWQSQWPNAYEVEKLALSTGEPETLLRLRDQYAAAMNPDIRRAIELIGDPQHIKAPVKAPLIEGQTDPEKETFKWFVANETGQVDSEQDREIPPQKQFLKPLSSRSDLPVFTQPTWRKRERRRF